MWKTDRPNVPTIPTWALNTSPCKGAQKRPSVLLTHLSKNLKEQTMRDIRFRAKAVGSGRWLYGDLVWTGDFHSIPAIFEEHLTDKDGAITAKASTLGMNTGLHDKKGTEIFAGDILAHDGKVIGHVVDGVRGYCFDVVYDKPVETLTWSLYDVVKRLYGNVEIVGNIYDNPDLLNPDKP